jgi:type I restriction enzyme S subunit
MSTKSVKFGTFANITSGYAFSSKQFNESEQGLPLIRCRDVNTKFAGVYYSGEYAPQYVVEDDDLLLSMDGDFKLLVWKFGKALLNQRVCRLEPDPKTVDKRYLLHFLPRTLDEIHKKTSFATVKHLSAKTVREIEIPLPHKNGKPDLEEQKRI